MSTRKQRTRLSPAAWGAIGLICVALLTSVVGPVLVQIINKTPVPTETSLPPPLTSTSTPSPILTDTPTSTATPTETPTATLTLEEPSILINSNFEQPIKGSRWEWNNNTDISWAAGYNGRSACFIQTAESPQMGPSWALIFQEANVIPGQTYRFIGWLKWDNAKQFHVKVEWYDVNHNFVQSDQLTPSESGTSSGWVERKGTVLAPLDAAIARFVALYGVDKDSDGKDINVPGGSVCLDEITFSPVK